MPNIGAGEILVILLIALLVLGPDKLPGAARSAGRAMGQIRKLSQGFEQEVRSAMHSVDPSSSASASSGAPKATSSVHPGLGPGPKLSAGSVVLGPSDSSPDEPAGAPLPTPAPPADGPSESFS